MALALGAVMLRWADDENVGPYMCACVQIERDDTNCTRVARGWCARGAALSAEASRVRGATEVRLAEAPRTAARRARQFEEEHHG